jgi:hypothetical protein
MTLAPSRNQEQMALQVYWIWHQYGWLWQWGLQCGYTYCCPSSQRWQQMLLLFQTHLGANSSKTYKYQKVLRIQPYNLNTGRAAIYMYAHTMVYSCLEALMGSLLWYGMQGSCPTTFHVFERCKTLTSKCHFQSREEPSQGLRPGKYDGFGTSGSPF